MSPTSNAIPALVLCGLSVTAIAYATARAIASMQDRQQGDYRLQEGREGPVRLIFRFVAAILIGLQFSSFRTQAHNYDRRVLEAGGFWGGLSGYEVLAAKWVFAVVLPLLFVGIGGWRTLGPGSGLVCTLLLAVVGYVFPSTRLNALASERQARFLKQLPYAMDALRVATECGLDFRSSIDRIIQVLVTGPVKQELMLYQKDLQIGKSAVEGLNDMAYRINLPGVAALLSAMAQAMEMGGGVGGLLRNSAEEMREKRRLSAQEEANKATVKLTFPLLFFILPGVFIVLLAPVAVDLVRTFSDILH